jgi:hypothetical protein
MKKEELLRELVDTVGKRGQAGQDLQNVVSVAMLSEGWDAKNVTHIMGLRAFTSQLLCEQVIGRACAAWLTTRTKTACTCPSSSTCLVCRCRLPCSREMAATSRHRPSPARRLSR